MKKLTLASIALYALLGITSMVFAQSDSDPVEPDTPGSCGDGDVGDSFATAYDLGNAEAWPRSPSFSDTMERIIVSDFECNGDLDVYRFEVSRSGLMWNRDGDIWLYDSAGTYVGDPARIGPGVYYVAEAAASDPDNRTETFEYRFDLLFELSPLEIQPTTARSPDGPAAVLLNLSPWQAWVHLYCQKDRPASDDDPAAPCTVRFECNGMSGEPASWTVNVAPKTIFSYWPTKTVDGTSANLQAALMAAGKTEDEARCRTTCEVFSPDPLAVRGYTLFGGQPTLVPVAVY